MKKTKKPEINLIVKYLIKPLYFAIVIFMFFFSSLAVSQPNNYLLDNNSIKDYNLQNSSNLPVKLAYTTIAIKIKTTDTPTLPLHYNTANKDSLISVKKSTDIIEENDEEGLDDGLASFDYVPILVKIGKDISFDIDIIIDDNNKMYFVIQEFFDKLEIYSVIDDDESVLTGFFTTEDKKYIIDFNKKTINFMGKTHDVKGKIKKVEGQIILDTKTINSIFNIKIDFNFRSLIVKLESFYELPIQRKNRFKEIRDNISKIQKKDAIPDTIIKRNYNKFKLGVFDWSVTSSQSKEGYDNATGVFSLGAEALYGQVDLSVILNSHRKFDRRSVRYKWRWVDNKNKYYKQLELGRINTNSVATISDPYVGAYISNKATKVRKAEGFYYISEYTMPDWEVELYINDVLVDHTKADGSGFYKFKVPNVFGTTRLTLKFYGPNGEERMLEKKNTNPIVMLPVNEYEYKFNTGIITDTIKTAYQTRGEVNYGVIKNLTVGGGAEYLNYRDNNVLLPFVKATYQATSFIMLTGQYIHGYKTEINANIRFNNSTSLDLNYERQAEGQTLNSYKFLEKRKLAFSMPYKIGWIGGFGRFRYTQTLNGSVFSNLGQLNLSAYYKNFSLNNNTEIRFYSGKEFTPSLTSDLTATYRWRYGVTISPTIKYNITHKRVGTYELNVEKRIKRGSFKLNFVQNNYVSSYYINLGFTYKFDQLRTSLNSSVSNNRFGFSESAGGSIYYSKDSRNTYSNTSAVGRGGIIITGFVDENHNKIFDEGEKKTLINSIKSRGGVVDYDFNDTIVKISNLNPFIEQFIEFNNNDLDVISWRFDHEVYSVMVDPNQFKHVNIPILPVGEVLGSVSMNGNGKGRMLVDIYKGDKLVKQIQSEDDGYVYYLGLSPGKYTAKINPKQLEKLKYISIPSKIKFVVKESYDGDMVDGVDFKLTEKIEYLDEDD